MRFLNKFLVNLSYLLGLEKNLGKPRYLLLELSNRCNLRCIMCERKNMKREQGDMKFELFKKIIDQSKKTTELVDFSFWGEPTLNKDFFKMVDYCKKNKVKTLVSTNFSRLTKKQIELLAIYTPDLLTISFDGINKNTYEKIRKGSYYKKTLKNIDYFLSICKDKKNIEVQSLYMEENKKEIHNFIKYWKRKGIKTRIKPLFCRDKDKTTLKNYPLAKTQKKKCIYPWELLACYWDGTIAGCCEDYDRFQRLGNLNNKTINQIWNNIAFRKFRQFHKKHKLRYIDLCKNCASVTVGNLYLIGTLFIDENLKRKLLSTVERIALKGKK